MHRHGECIVHIVIEVRPRTDNKVDEARLHQRDDAATKASRSEGTRHSKANRDIVFRHKHLLNIETCCFIEAGCIIRLKLLINEFRNGHIWMNAMGKYLGTTQVVPLGGMVVFWVFMMGHMKIALSGK